MLNGNAIHYFLIKKKFISQEWRLKLINFNWLFFPFFSIFSVNDDCSSKQTSNKDSSDVFTLQLNSLLRGVGGGSSVKDSFLNNNNNNKDAPANDGNVPQQFDAKCYIENGKINFGKLITDEVLAADHKLVEAAKKTVCINRLLKKTITNHNNYMYLIVSDQYSRYHSINCNNSR